MKIKAFMKKEMVMSVAFVLALLSSLALLPSFEEIKEDIDWSSLGILLTLMLSVSGFKRLGLFKKVGTFILRFVKDTRTLVTVLVMLCFVLSMAFTNDVALITFVPFALYILDSLNHRELMIKTVALQTVAANMGSMLTPIGNPQNLYIFSFYDLTLEEFFSTMAPYTLVSLIAIIIIIFTIKKEVISLDPNAIAVDKNAISVDSNAISLDPNAIKVDLNALSDVNESGQNSYSFSGILSKIKSLQKLDSVTVYRIQLVAFAFIFILALLSVGRIISWYYVLLVAIAIIALTDYIVLFKVDYALLLTFIFFFIFIGNLGSVHQISMWLLNTISGKEVIIGAISSQFLSNVPAALLLSGFTDNGIDLLVGVNLGGLGTLIASMASLISYKFISTEYEEFTGKYLRYFSIVNFILLGVLLALSDTVF